MGVAATGTCDSSGDGVLDSRGVLSTEIENGCWAFVVGCSDGAGVFAGKGDISGGDTETDSDEAGEAVSFSIIGCAACSASVDCDVTVSVSSVAEPSDSVGYWALSMSA